LRWGEIDSRQGAKRQMTLPRRRVGEASRLKVINRPPAFLPK
jgi:hypothetical protein